MPLLAVGLEYLGDKMVVTRFSSKNEDKEAAAWLEALSAKGATDEEIEEALAEYESHSDDVSPRRLYEMKREEYKREKSRAGLETGKGGFKRSQ